MNPTARSKAMLEKDGWLVGNVEKFVRFPPPGHRVDLFGMFDLIAVKGDDVLGIQVTSGSNVTARIAKMRSNPTLEHWNSSMFRRAIVHGWRKVGPRGKRKMWDCRQVAVDSLARVPFSPAKNL